MFDKSEVELQIMTQRLSSRRLRRHAESHDLNASVPEVTENKTCTLEVGLYVRWHCPAGKTKVTHLSLKPLESLDALQGLSKSLLSRAFPDDVRPDYLTSADFYRFTPSEEFLSLPGDTTRTDFRLIVNYDGWEYCVLERELGAHRDPDRKMLVTVMEFESTALMIGTLGLRVSFIAYPLVSIKKSFLDDIQHRLAHDESFRGIL